jgi:uncharacterized protein YegJ (DUF2314 family)
MPRGNDSSVEAAALRSQYGIHANADEMIRGVRASVDPAVQKASLLAIDEEATADLDLKTASSKFDLEEGEELTSFVVRGNAIIGVIENEHGYTRKAVVGANSDYKAPKLTAADHRAAAAAKRDARIAAETARLRAEADERIEQAREEENARVAEELAKIRESADKEVAAAAKSDDKPAAAAAPAPRPAQAPAQKPAQSQKPVTTTTTAKPK